jgi:hypothetical protein
MTGIIVSLVAIATLAVYIYRISNKLRVTKGYIKALLEKSFSDENFKNDNIDFKRDNEATQAADLEFIKYSIIAKSDSNKTYELEGMLYNPEAELEDKEYEQMQKEVKAEDKAATSVMSGDPTSANTATIESAQSLLSDQNKRETEERMIRASILKHELGLKIAGNLSKKSRLIPQIYHYDQQKLFAIYEKTGKVLLKDHLVEQNEEAQDVLIFSIVADLAKMHNNLETVRSLLPPRRDMEAEDFRQLLRLGLDKIYESRLLNANQVQEILNEYFSIGVFLTDPYYANIKLQGLSPYNMVYENGKVFLEEFAKFDIGPHLTSLVEFLKDPLIYSGKEREKEALAAYFSIYKSDMSFEEFTKLYHLTSAHILTVQLFYMKLFIKKVEEKGQDPTLAPLINWDKDHLNLIFSDAKDHWQSYDESKFFIEKLEEIFLSI